MIPESIEREARASKLVAFQHVQKYADDRGVNHDGPRMYSLVEEWAAKTGLHRLAVNSGFQSGLSFLLVRDNWRTPMRELFGELEETGRLLRDYKAAGQTAKAAETTFSTAEPGTAEEDLAEQALDVALTEVKTAEDKLEPRLKAKPTWSYDTRVKYLTEADLDDIVTTILPGPGTRRQKTLRQVLDSVRRALSNAGDSLRCPELLADSESEMTNEDFPVGRWLDCSGLRFEFSTQS